ncbi:hypothetical protein BC833DRAFT_204078 [Globomyces pollinis-pini]|nr:hypothetical protein BC833DRAFT_204078 [Globomyces pollinis-pini]
MLAFKVNKSVAQFALSNDVDSIVKQLIENHVNQCEVIIADMIKTVRDTVETVLLKEINEKLKNYPTQSSNTSEPAISKVPLPPRPLVKSQTDPENNMAPPPPNTDLKPQRDVEIPVLPPKPPARTDLNLKSEIEPDSSVPKPTDVSEHEDTEIEQSAPPKPPVRADLVADGPPKPPNRTDLVAEPSLSTSPPKPPARTDIETVKLAEPDVSAIQENVVAKQKSKQELNAAAEVITTKKSTEDLKSLKSKSSNDLVGGKVEKTPSKNSLGSSNNLAADPSPAKKKGGFGSGFKSMLNHITKGRPKPKRKEDEDSAKEPVEVVHTEEPVSLAEPVENSNSTV